MGPNFFDPKLTRAKLFQTERTRRLACLLSFCELVEWNTKQHRITNENVKMWLKKLKCNDCSLTSAKFLWHHTPLHILITVNTFCYLFALLTFEHCLFHFPLIIDLGDNPFFIWMNIFFEWIKLVFKRYSMFEWIIQIYRPLLGGR